MKRLLAIVIMMHLVILVRSQDSPSELFSNGNSEYENGNYQSAINQYLKVIETDNHSDDLYLNLGNAYYELDKIGYSILYYEKGLLLDPNNRKILENIALAKEKVDSEIFEVPPFLPVRIWRGFVKIISSNGWALMQIITLILLLFIWYSKLFIKLEWSEKKFNLIIRSLIGSVIFLGLVLWSSLKLNSEEVYGIALEEVQVQSGPDERSNNQSNVQAGEKVRLIELFDDWYKVELLNKEAGYIEKSKLGVI